MELKLALEIIEELDRRMRNCSSTSGRKNNYEAILNIMRECPETEKYWQHYPQAYRMVDRIEKINLNSLPRASRKTITVSSIYAQEFAYVVSIPKEKMIKVGKTCNLNRRMRELEREYETEIDLLQIFEFENAEDAYLMEVLLHKYFKKKYPKSFVPQDRFADAIFDDKDAKILLATAEKIKEIIWF
jgi:hypothetical protein